MKSTDSRFIEEALKFHSEGRPGKIQIVPTKPLQTQQDLSLAYSPGVAIPCMEIYENEDRVFDYTAKGNLVAVITNGTAVLGLGNIGASASKPVMEGKSVLFKRFADVDSIDIEVDCEDVDDFVHAVKSIAKTFGGINLEDIKAPECFIIEQRLRETLDIPVFHDDQHGTAIIAAAGLINALDLAGKLPQDIKIVANGAGAASIACVELIKAIGVPHENVIICDSKGVIYQGRTEGMNQWKSAHAIETSLRSLEEAMVGADVFLGLSVAGAITPKMVETMAANPIIFAMANPDPEINPEDAHQVRPDIIMATGRSDYPNQVNNVLGFPYIFRGALDVRASTINDAMKIAAAEAIASLAKEDVPDEVAHAYGGKKLRFGKEYIIPAPFDPRLLVEVPVAVAKAAMDSGVARRPIYDLSEYRHQLRSRLNPINSLLQTVFVGISGLNKRVVFSDGESERTLRAAQIFNSSDYGQAILIAEKEKLKILSKETGTSLDGLTIIDPAESNYSEGYAAELFKKHQREGMTLAECEQMVRTNSSVFAGCMVNAGDADALVSGGTHSFSNCYQSLRLSLGLIDGAVPMGLTIAIAEKHTLFLADTAVIDEPNAQELFQIAKQSAKFVRELGHTPRVAFVSYSSFGSHQSAAVLKLREALELFWKNVPDVEADGEMSLSVALDHNLCTKLYPFSKLTDSANILIMPNLHSGHICVRMVHQLGAASIIGPVLIGFRKPAKIAQSSATTNEVVSLAALAAYESIDHN